jgi:hypothetical protein
MFGLREEAELPLAEDAPKDSQIVQIRTERPRQVVYVRAD